MCMDLTPPEQPQILDKTVLKKIATVDGQRLIALLFGNCRLLQAIAVQQSSLLNAKIDFVFVDLFNALLE